ncbi:MAG: DNA polymerase/3'-5' exonuclease PolX [bacterium]|nr:DNA polymerase/3'-5' exonuclease PolX [bacterium]
MAQLTYKNNKEISLVCREIAYFLEMEGVAFKPRAYEKVAEVIFDLSEDVFDIYLQGAQYQNKFGTRQPRTAKRLSGRFSGSRGGLKALESIPGVGVSIAEKVEEFLKTGKIKYLEDLKKKWPVKIEEFMAIEGVGPKTVRHLYEKLGVKNLNDLELALKKNKISGLEGFGEKSQEKILKSIEFHKKSGGRAVLGFIMPEIKKLEEKLKIIKGVERVDIAGSARRKKETIGDIDILIISKNSKPVMDFFANMPEVEKVFAYGETKSAVRLKNGLDADLRVVPPESYGAALNYFTGSKEHNIALREIAGKKGYKLNEYGLFKGSKMIAGKTEEEIYEKLGLRYIEPEMREMQGEIEAAKNGKLPKLIGYKDLMGDLHVHSVWSDGSNSIEEMARAAIERGLGYIVISDHSKHLGVAHGLDEKRLKQQWKEIDAVNKKLEKEGEDFKILKGTECDILKDGSMDFSDEILKQFDVVGASVHSSFNLSEEEQTERIKKAMENKNVDILCHPTGRIINQREPYKVSIDEIIKVAKETGTILEINSFPNRLDLKDEYIKKCVEAEVKMSIGSDAHLFSHLDCAEYGVAQARRGWAEKKDIINAWPIEKMLKMLK